MLVSVGYRLVRETQLPAIIENLKDGLKWVRKTGPELLDADPSRPVVVSVLSGGYLALMSGVFLNPPAAAVVSYLEIRVRGRGVAGRRRQGNGRGRATFFLYMKQHGR